MIDGKKGFYFDEKDNPVFVAGEDNLCSFVETEKKKEVTFMIPVKEIKKISKEQFQRFKNKYCKQAIIILKNI